LSKTLFPLSQSPFFWTLAISKTVSVLQVLDDGQDPK